MYRSEVLLDEDKNHGAIFILNSLQSKYIRYSQDGEVLFSLLIHIAKEYA